MNIHIVIPLIIFWCLIYLEVSFTSSVFCEIRHRNNGASTIFSPCVIREWTAGCIFITSKVVFSMLFFFRVYWNFNSIVASRTWLWIKLTPRNFPVHSCYMFYFQIPTLERLNHTCFRYISSIVSILGRGRLCLSEE